MRWPAGLKTRPERSAPRTPVRGYFWVALWRAVRHVVASQERENEGIRAETIRYQTADGKTALNGRFTTVTAQTKATQREPAASLPNSYPNHVREASGSSPGRDFGGFLKGFGMDSGVFWHHFWRHLMTFFENFLCVELHE